MSTSNVGLCKRPKIFKAIDPLIISFGKLSKIKDKIPHLEMFIHERIDVRLKLLQEYDKIIFIPDKLNPESVSDNYIPYNIYFQQVKFSKGIDKLISEITVPLKFRNVFTYGYISAQSHFPMDDYHLEFVQSLANNWKKTIFSEHILHGK